MAASSSHEHRTPPSQPHAATVTRCRRKQVPPVRGMRAAERRIGAWPRRRQRQDLDPHRLARELPHQRRARLRRHRPQGAAPQPGRGVRARRRDRLLRHRRPGLRRDRPRALDDVRGPHADLAPGPQEAARRTIRGGSRPSRSSCSTRRDFVAGRGARRRARARAQVARRALASRLPGPAAHRRRGRRRAAALADRGRGAGAARRAMIHERHYSLEEATRCCRGSSPCCRSCATPRTC